MKYDNDFAVAIDFDNTITQNSTYEQTGTLNEEAAEAIIHLKEIGCKLILWTCRTGKDLDEAVALAKDWKLPFDYVNEYPPRGDSKKVNVDFYIDDKSWTRPLDWNEIVRFIKLETERKLTLSLPEQK